MTRQALSRQAVSAIPPVTRQFADLIADTRFENLPVKTVEATNLAFFDWAGCVVAGSRSAVAAKTAAVATEEQAQGGSLVFATGERTSPHWAAFANGSASHSIELDDVHMGSIIHGGIVICSAALAVAEHLKVDGKKLLEGLVVGFDVAYRVGEAIAKAHYPKFHSTGTVATFGSAAAAAKIMGLSSEQTAWALGNAASQAAGLWQYLKMGDDTKVLHPGKAAMNGVLAATLARHGFNGSDEAIEGERGFVATLSDEVDWNVMTDGLGRKFKVEENGYKIHACCRHGHVSIDAALRLANENDLKPEQIKSVQVSLNRNSCDTLGDANPPSPYKAKFSIAYFMAMAFMYRKVGLEAFTDERLGDAKVRDFMSRVKMVENPEFTKTYPTQWTAEVRVELRDGRTLTARGDQPEGDPQTNVPVDNLEQKCLDLMTPVVGMPMAADLLAAMKNLPAVKNVRELFANFPKA